MATRDQILPKPVRWVGSSGAVYVLHTFQKKSRHGIATPRAALKLIEQRLGRAREDYEQWSRSKTPTSR